MAWSNEAIHRNRRKRKARRMMKRAPLLAEIFMREEYPDYDHEQLLHDITLKDGTKIERKHGSKAGKATNGKMIRVLELKREFLATGDWEIARKMMKIYATRNEPWRLRFRVGDEVGTYEYSNNVHPRMILELLEAANASQTFEEYEGKEKEILKYTIY